MKVINSAGQLLVSQAGGGGGGGTTFSAGVSTLGNTLGNTRTVSDQVVFAGIGGVTLSQSTNAGSATISISANAQTTQPAVNAFGATNTGNTSGDTGTSSGITWVLAGTNNITISESTVGGGPNTLWVSGAAAGGAQTAISGIANSQTTFTSGTVSLSDQANITIASSVNGATQIFKFSVAAQSTQPAINAFGVSNTGTTAGNTGTSSGITWVVAASGNITASQSTAGGGPNTVWLSVPAQTTQPAINALGVSNTGNTAGNTGTSSGITWVLAGSNANTLSQSTAGGGPNTIWIQGPLSATTISGVQSANSIGTRGSRFALEDHFHQGIAQFQISGNTSNTSNSVVGSLVLAGGNNITLSQVSAAGAATVTISAAAQTTQPAVNAFGATNTGNTAGNTGTSSGITWVLAGSNNITISESTVGGGPNTLWVSGAAAGGAQTAISGIANSQTTYTSGTVSLSDQANITIASSVNGATQIFKFSVAAQSTQPAVNALGVSDTGNTAGNTGTSSGITWVLAGSNANTLSQSTAGGGPNTIWIQGPVSATTISAVSAANVIGTRGSRFALEDHQHAGVFSAGASNVGSTAGNTTVVPGRFVFAGSGGVTISQETAANSLNTLHVQGPVSATTISQVTTANVIGTRGTRFALEDHQHLGVAAVAPGSNTGNTAGNTATQPGGTWVIAGSNMITISGSSGAAGIHTAWVQATQTNPGFSAAGGSSSFQTLTFADTNSVSWTNTNGSIGVASIKLQMFAVSNTTQSSSGTANHTALSFGGAGIASVGVTGGSVVISVPAGGGAGDGGVFAGVSTMGNTAGSTGTVSTGNFVLVGTGAMTLSQSTGAAGSAATVTLSVPQTSSLSATGFLSISTNVSTISIGAGPLSFYAVGNTTQSSSGTIDGRSISFSGAGDVSVGISNGSVVISGDPVQSSYQNFVPIGASSVLTWNGASVSDAVHFDIPRWLSASFIRIPALMTTNSTTIATLASATATASGRIVSTLNFGIYSMGTGASSKSLMSVTTATTGFTFSQQISVTNSTQASYSLGLSFQAEGAGTSLSTQYSVSNTNYSFTTNWATAYTSARFIDIPFAASLAEGDYWAIIGLSTSSDSGGAGGLAALTNCNVRYSAHYGASFADLSFGVMGSTNRTSGGLMGAGSFSTAGGGTTSGLPISAISSRASLAMPYFQMLRSA